MILLLFVLVLVALASVAPLFGVDSRSRSDDSWDRDSLWSTSVEAFVSVREVSVDVRPSRPEELTAAGETVRHAYRADGLALDGYGDVLADTATRAAHAEVVVAVEDGVVLGCVTFVQPGTRYAELSRPGEAEFRMLGVAPAARARGIGEALATWCLDRARALGAGRLVLSSDVRMTGAHRLYERLGFVREPALDWSPLPGVDLLAFSHALVVSKTSA